MKIKPCKKCGGADIKLWDCGYSSFNPGGGKCQGCGAEAKGEAGCDPTQDVLAHIWNQGQEPTQEEKMKAEIKRLRAANRRLRKQFQNFKDACWMND